MKTTDADLSNIVNETGVTTTIAKIIANRGVKSIDGVKSFINSSLADLYDPFLMKDMILGTEIIMDAIDSGEKIIIYGDYDADGVTSTSILYLALKRLDANVDYYIPDRETEGYGMSIARIQKLHENGVKVILTCDNGISAIEEIKFAKELGFTIVVTDHHELRFFVNENGDREYLVPEADAIINPKQKDCEYPYENLCGAGIALKFAQVLLESIGYSLDEITDLIEIAGIGTICDVVDLVGENRIIAKKGLEYINNTSNLGLKALIEILGIKGQEIKAYHIGFMIGPCINATGRLDTANLSVELLLTKDNVRAYELANILNELNKKRQQMTNENVDSIIESIYASDLINDKVLVCYKPDVHESIAGIVAGKVREKFNVPTFIITKAKEGVKGSGRSIDEYNMFEELLKCKDILSKFGGHPMAAGLSLEESKICDLRRNLNDNCCLTEKDLALKIKIDKRLHLSYITNELINEISNLEPFGKGNPTPVFADKNIPISAIRILGENKNVLKLTCRISQDNLIEGICFNRVEDFIDIIKNEYNENYEKVLYNPDGLKLDMVFIPQFNEYNGQKKKQIRITDFRISSKGVAN